MALWQACSWLATDHVWHGVEAKLYAVLRGVILCEKNTHFKSDGANTTLPRSRYKGFDYKGLTLVYFKGSCGQREMGMFSKGLPGLSSDSLSAAP